MTVKIEKRIVGWRVGKKKKFSLPPENHAAPRPPELACDIHRARIRGEDWVIFVGLFEGVPYEVMGGLSKYIEIPGKYKTGVIIKRPRKTVNSRYDLRFGEAGDEVLLKDIVSIFDNPNNGAMTRMISMLLRHHVPLHFVVEQLQKDKTSDMFSFSRVVSRVLKKYIQDGIKGNGKCAECGSGDLIYQGGCPLCKDCGHSKCG